MSWEPRRSPLLSLLVAATTQAVRRPYLSLSVAAHTALLGLLYYFGSYQLELREQEAEVASSLRATGQASTAKRLQDLQTIKQLMEKSAAIDPEPGLPPAVPQTPQEMVEQARELSKAIDALDKEIKAEELAQLTGVPKPPPAAEPPPAAAPQAPVAQTTAASNNAAPESKEPVASEKPSQQLGAKANEAQADAGKAGEGKAGGSTPAPVTQEMADSEVAALEAKARATLAKRQQRLEAKANGVQVEGGKPGSGGDGTGGRPGAPSVKGGGSDTSVLAEISNFIAADARTEHATSSKRYWGTDFFDHGKAQIPPVDAAGLVRGQGRVLGQGGEYANRVYLNSWYVIGPFPGRHEGGLFDNPTYPPEKAVLLDAVYYGKDKRLLKWRYVTAQSYPFVPPDQVEDSVYYGYTEVFVDEAQDLIAWIGADDDVQIYLNDRMVWKGGNANKATYFDTIFNGGPSYLRDYNRTEGKRLLHFNKGRNKLFFKLSNGPNASFLSMVLTRSESR
ncbi:hypothetical protein [Roseateles sp. P5_E11]